MTKKKYIKSPLNYTGGKFKLLPQILPLFPSDVNTFVDLFGGGFNVGVNIDCNKVIYNDTQAQVVDLLKYLNGTSVDRVIGEINSIIRRYELSDSSANGYEHYGTDSSSGLGSYNKKNYMKLREDYNTKDRSPIMFYTMVVFAFSNQIRFNSKGEFNMPVNKRDFNNSLEKNLIAFISRLEDIDVSFVSGDFRRLKIDKLSQDDLVYCDPPYLISTATYNEAGGWNRQDEEDLLRMLDKLDSEGVRFALSNVLAHKGKKNEILVKWCGKYNINYLDVSYNNCNYQLKSKESGKSVEVLVTNY